MYIHICRDAIFYIVPFLLKTKKQKKCEQQPDPFSGGTWGDGTGAGGGGGGGARLEAEGAANVNATGGLGSTCAPLREVTHFVLSISVLQCVCCGMCCSEVEEVTRFAFSSRKFVCRVSVGVKTILDISFPVAVAFIGNHSLLLKIEGCRAQNQGGGESWLNT